MFEDKVTTIFQSTGNCSPSDTGRIPHKDCFFF